MSQAPKHQKPTPQALCQLHRTPWFNMYYHCVWHVLISKSYIDVQAGILIIHILVPYCWYEIFGSENDHAVLESEEVLHPREVFFRPMLAGDIIVRSH